MIRNAWHISGGEGWCANSSCRRVLVTHNDGHQTVEEIKNDIGMGKLNPINLKSKFNKVSNSMFEILLIGGKVATLHNSKNL